MVINVLSLHCCCYAQSNKILHLKLPNDILLLRVQPQLCFSISFIVTKTLKNFFEESCPPCIMSSSGQCRTMMLSPAALLR